MKVEVFLTGANQRLTSGNLGKSPPTQQAELPLAVRKIHHHEQQNFSVSTHKD